MSESKNKNVRWQIYSVLGYDGPRADKLLRKGLIDRDPYCRRRALLSLGKLQPDDSNKLVEQYMNDPDPYMRQASINLLRAVKDSDFKRIAINKLINDDVQHVAEAAKELL